MAQLYLADEDAEDVDGRCLELRKRWMADDHYQLMGLHADKGVHLGRSGCKVVDLARNVVICLRVDVVVVVSGPAHLVYVLPRSTLPGWSSFLRELG